MNVKLGLDTSSYEKSIDGALKVFNSFQTKLNDTKLGFDSSQISEYKLQQDIQFPGNVIGLTGNSISTYYCTSIVTVGDKILDGFILSDLSSIRNSIQRETDINILGIISYTQMQALGIILNPSKNEINGI